ncbi:MAG TPA: alpha-galactosidase [Verrucomicrobiae bacterium]|nr:alpha-galactosidase [Verrucomicrobiae bacterium]
MLRDALRTASSALLLCALSLTLETEAADALQKTEGGDRTPIVFDEGRKVFLLQTDHSSYAFGLGSNGRFVNLHWGGKLKGVNDVPEPWETHHFLQPHGFTHGLYGRYEYPARTRDYFLEPCLKIERPDSLVDLRLSYDAHAIDGDRLDVGLKAANAPFHVTLHYRVHPAFDLIDRWVEVQNRGTEQLVIENLQSAVWYVPHTRKYRLTHIAGNWGAEWLVRRDFLTPGEIVLQSRNGISGHHHVPFFALDQDGVATEKSGTVWFGTVQWSGNWKMIVEQDPNEQVRVSGGYNDCDFAVELAPGESHSTPVFTAGFTCGGFGEASRMLHRYQREHLYPKNMRDVEVPMVFNTYSALPNWREGGVTEESVMSLIAPAAQAGFEAFIIDAGWQTAIGDWTVHPIHFPRGLRPVSDAVHRAGMKFGLWIEPERITQQAKLIKEKPEWLFAKGGGTAMLNLSRRDVLEYVHDEMVKLLRDHGVDYLKLDFNRYFEIAEGPDRRALNTQYVLNFYELFDRLTKEFPAVFFENCASGAGRPDLKMDAYFARINRSDIQSPIDSIYLHEGFTYLHPGHMAGGGSNMGGPGGRIPFQFSAFTGMMGWASVGQPLHKKSPGELAQIRQYGSLFKSIRHVTCRGEIHRLASLREHPYAAFEYVLPDRSEALLFLFAHGLRHNERVPNILLEALDPDSIYDVKVYGALDEWQKAGRAVSGRALMEAGLLADLGGDYDSRIFHFTRRK